MTPGEWRAALDGYLESQGVGRETRAATSADLERLAAYAGPTRSVRT